MKHKRVCSATCQRPTGDFQRHCAYLFVDQPISGEDDGASELVRIAREIRNFATGFFNQQNACGSIPFRKAEFPESVEAAARHGGKIQGGRAITAHSVRALGEIAVVLQIRARFTVAHGKAGAEEAGRKRADLGDVNFLAVERGAFAALSRE